jgi:hypothetical protein
MYVRWQSRKRRTREFGRGYYDGDTHWRAVLVENVRIDGRPTQRHIAYLAGFTESALAIPAQHCYLWERIEKHLGRLANRISPEDRERIEAALIKKIGKPPSKKQREAVHQEAERILGELADHFASKKRNAP